MKKKVLRNLNLNKVVISKSLQGKVIGGVAAITKSKHQPNNTCTKIPATG